MKTSTLLASLCCAIAAPTTHADDIGTFATQSANFSQRHDRAPSFMLYLQKGVGAKHSRQSNLSFGFAIERDAGIGGSANFAVANRSMRLLDLSYSVLDRGAIRVNGFSFKSNHGHYDYAGSYGEDSWYSPWLWLGIGAGALLGISCATDNFPCDGGSNGNSDYEPPYTPPAG